ncbi:MAG: hypothetical protein MUE85_14155 [Microscillaceae bacterium]|nr:hypothetical protein [Microscillaceae bacterium]
MKKLFLINLLIINTLYITAQTKPSPNEERYPRYFKNLAYIGLSLGYAKGDMEEFNRWAVFNGYDRNAGNYVPLHVEMAVSTNRGVLIGFEGSGNFRNTSALGPNLGYFGFKLGYHIRTFNTFDLNFMTGIGLNYNRISFRNHRPTPALQDIANIQSYDLDAAYLRQLSMMISPELSLNYVFVRPDRGWVDEHLMVFVKAGINVNVLRSNWEYGMMVSTGQDSSTFDSVNVDYLRIPNTLPFMYYIRFGLAYKISFN